MNGFDVTARALARHALQHGETLSSPDGAAWVGTRDGVNVQDALDRLTFASLADLLASEILPQQAGRVWRAGSHSYVEAEGSVEDHDLVTVRGVKLYLDEEVSNPCAVAAVAFLDNATIDASPAFTTAIHTGGYRRRKISVPTGVSHLSLDIDGEADGIESLEIEGYGRRNSIIRPYGVIPQNSGGTERAVLNIRNVPGLRIANLQLDGQFSCYRGLRLQSCPDARLDGLYLHSAELDNGDHATHGQNLFLYDCPRFVLNDPLISGVPMDMETMPIERTAPDAGTRELMVVGRFCEGGQIVGGWFDHTGDTHLLIAEGSYRDDPKAVPGHIEVIGTIFSQERAQFDKPSSFCVQTYAGGAVNLNGVRMLLGGKMKKGFHGLPKLGEVNRYPVGMRMSGGTISGAREQAISIAAGRYCSIDGVEIDCRAMDGTPIAGSVGISLTSQYDARSTIHNSSVRYAGRSGIIQRHCDTTDCQVEDWNQNGVSNSFAYEINGAGSNRERLVNCAARHSAGGQKFVGRQPDSGLVHSLEIDGARSYGATIYETLPGSAEVTTLRRVTGAFSDEENQVIALTDPGPTIDARGHDASHVKYLLSNSSSESPLDELLCHDGQKVSLIFADGNTVVRPRSESDTGNILANASVSPSSGSTMEFEFSSTFANGGRALRTGYSANS